ncbi:HAD-IA family hydrolase [Marinibaculum pumilum]|uniref:HAD-IA family hydrolase n=1 Tax=Marinibaculum pumilum TaxID=1766165 RepID=A0ABV7KX90_9PROT
MSDAQAPVRAVLWDFGGVFTTSPFEAFARYEAEKGLPKDFLRQVNATNPDGNAWAAMERSEISVDEFDRRFRAESAAAGHEVPGRDVLDLLSGDVREEMVTALKIVADRYRTACITNNMRMGHGPAMAGDTAKASRISGILDLFEVVIESSKVGMRKPEPGIYQMACRALEVEPSEAVYLDDLGVNLKPAKAMGMRTIKVAGAGQALDELEAILGHGLR